MRAAITWLRDGDLEEVPLLNTGAVRPMKT